VSAPLAHPAWCDPARCEVAFGRAHSSGVLVMPRDEHSASRAQLRLWRTSGQPGTYVELVLGDHGAGVRIRADLSLQQADQLRLFLSDLLRLTGGTR
jgi:hypothetical protein